MYEFKYDTFSTARNNIFFPFENFFWKMCYLYASKIEINKNKTQIHT